MDACMYTCTQKEIERKIRTAARYQASAQLVVCMRFHAPVRILECGSRRRPSDRYPRCHKNTQQHTVSHPVVSPLSVRVFLERDEKNWQHAMWLVLRPRACLCFVYAYARVYACTLAHLPLCTSKNTCR